MAGSPDGGPELVRVAGSSRGVGVVVAGLAIVLGGVVGIGVFGGRIDAGLAHEPDRRTGATPTSGLHAGPMIAVAPAARAIRLVEPHESNQVITTRRVTVRGYVADRTTQLTVALEARGNRRLDTQQPPTSPTSSGAGYFQAAFDLPNPRPNGRMWIVATVLDGSGIPIDSLRVPIQVGALVPRAEPTPRLVGNDGGVGGIGFQAPEGYARPGNRGSMGPAHRVGQLAL